jgi:hypothetical protein
VVPRPYFTLASPPSSKHNRKPSTPPWCRCTPLDAYHVSLVVIIFADAVAAFVVLSKAN